MPGIDFDKVVPGGDFFHDANLRGIENGEEYAVQEQQRECAKAELVTEEKRNQQNGNGHADGSPAHDTVLRKTPCKVTGDRHHDDARREHGELEQEAQPKESASFRIKSYPTLKMDEQSQLHERTEKNRNVIGYLAGVYCAFHIALKKLK